MYTVRMMKVICVNALLEISTKASVYSRYHLCYWLSNQEDSNWLPPYIHHRQCVCVCVCTEWLGAGNVLGAAKSTRELVCVDNWHEE